MPGSKPTIATILQLFSRSPVTISRPDLVEQKTNNGLPKLDFRFVIKSFLRIFRAAKQLSLEKSSFSKVFAFLSLETFGRSVLSRTLQYDIH